MVKDFEKIKEIEKLANSIEHNLYLYKNYLRNLKELDKLSDSLFEDSEKLKKISYEENYKRLIREKISSKKLDFVVDDLSKELYDFGNKFSNLSSKLDNLKELFSKMKTFDTFIFKDQNEMFMFVEKCFEINKDDTILITPQILGIIKLDEFAKANLLDIQNNSVVVRDKSVTEVLSLLKNHNIKENFMLANSKITVIFLKPNELKVVAEPSTIRRIELLYKEKK
ncbi:MAG: hypothetical protein N3D73_00390 [Candidatus Diapherotrites archaeon]|nr:hypothetical protein [Candidatus Diapherotrites archaeon]